VLNINLLAEEKKLISNDNSVFITVCKFKDIEKDIPRVLSLFTEEEKIELKNIDIMKGGKGNLVYNKISSEFEMQVKVQKKDYFKINLTFKFGEFPKDVFFKEYGIKIPVVLTGDKTQIKITCGGERRYDWWYIDQSKIDSSFPKWLISDSVSRWPVWGIGGVYQDSPTHYKIWKTNKLDTYPLNTDEGSIAPGWIDIIDEKNNSGMLIWLENFKDNPKAITFNYYEKNLYIYFHTPYSLAIEAPSKKVLSYTIHFYFHDDEFDFDELPNDINKFITDYIK